jgi:hyperosmotically inducible protein
MFMKSIPILTAAVLAALAVAACDRPGTKSGAASTTTTTVASTAPTTPAQTADSTAPSTPSTSASTSTPSTAATGSDSSNVVNDTMVTGKVKAAITADNGMKDSDISVKTENGVVTLTGSAKSPDQVTLASALAQRQEGVSRIENQITVK